MNNGPSLHSSDKNSLHVPAGSTTFRPMNEGLISLLACPATGKPPALHDAKVDGHGTRSGVLRTADGSHEYPIVDSVPRFVASESYAASFGLEWNAFNRVQLDSANGTTISRTRFQALTGHSPAHFKGKRV